MATHDEFYPATYVSQDATRWSQVQISGSYVGVQEETTTREFDASGRLRYERTERRSCIAPVTSVPADRFAPRPARQALDAGDEAAFRQVLAGIALAERVSANGHE